MIARAGIENLRFKPAYNPYTEPSMEVFSYHAGLNKVVEIGNSGSMGATCPKGKRQMALPSEHLVELMGRPAAVMFRPEMLRPMGLPEDVVVIAWGLSVERYGQCRPCPLGRPLPMVLVA